MKTPIDIVKGKITDIDEHGIVTIKCRYDDWRTLLRRQYSECLVQMIDSRPLSDKQRRTCYKLLREISNYTGMGLDPTKEYMKLKFLVEDLEQTADQMFSLSNAPMSLVCAFQRFLVHFIDLYNAGILPDGDEFWYGTTATTADVPVFWSEKHHTFVSVEPILGPFTKKIDSSGIGYMDWFIIGAETGNRKEKVVPKREWIENIVDYARSVGKPVFMKDSLKPIWGDDLITEFPWEAE